MSADDSTDDNEQTEWHDTTLGTYGPFAGLGVGLLLPWGSVSAPFIGTLAVRGIETSLGQLIALAALGILATVEREWQPRIMRGVGGAGILVFLLLYLFSLNQRIGQLQTQLQGNPFAATVHASVGIGLYLSILSTAVIAYAGYTSSQHHHQTNEEAEQ